MFAVIACFFKYKSVVLRMFYSSFYLAIILILGTALCQVDFNKLELECSKLCAQETSQSSRAVNAFWSHNIVLADSCACHSLLHNKNDGISEAIRYECLYSKHMPSSYRLSNTNVNKPAKDSPNVLNEFDILGPIPIGKLEVSKLYVNVCLSFTT